MTLAELTNYILLLASQTGKDEPQTSPLLDAGFVVQTFLPAAFREAAREQFKHKQNLQQLIRPHQIPLTDGVGSLPAGLEEEFSDSFQVEIDIDRVLVTIEDAEYDAGTVTVTDIGATGSLLNEYIGHRGVFRNLSNVVIADGVIRRVPTSNTAEINVAPGVGSPSGTLTIYRNTFTVRKIVDEVSMFVGTDDVLVSSSDTFAAGDEDKLIIIEETGFSSLRSIIETYVDVDEVDLFDVSAENYATATATVYDIASPSQDPSSRVGLFSHYPQYEAFVRADDDILPRFHVSNGQIHAKDINDGDFTTGEVLTVRGVTVPQIPATDSTAITAPESFLDSVIAIAAGVLKGERSLQSIGLDEKQPTR